MEAQTRTQIRTDGEADECACAQCRAQPMPAWLLREAGPEPPAEESRRT